MAMPITATTMAITTTIMAETTTLLRLMSWLSPVFPTGGFAYSTGLEQAVADRTVHNRTELHRWIAAGLAHGPLWTDAVLLTQAHSNVEDASAIADLAALARALPLSAERHAETIDQGTAFIDAASHWLDPSVLPARETPLPVAVGAAARASSIDLIDTLAAYLNTFATNQLQCAIRLSVTGQSGAAKTLAALEPVIADTAQRVATATRDDLGSCGFGIDIASMNHETLQPRLFLS